MKILGMALLVMASSAIASSNAYDLKIDLSLDGKHVASPRMTVKEGELASITQSSGSEKRFVEVVATEGSVQDRKGILMKFVVGTIGANGERTVLSKPQILAKEGLPAKITESDSLGGAERFSLSVTATKTGI